VPAAATLDPSACWAPEIFLGLDQVVPLALDVYFAASGREASEMYTSWSLKLLVPGVPV
jgi:hypothetical protein